MRRWGRFPTPKLGPFSDTKIGVGKRHQNLGRKTVPNSGPFSDPKIGTVFVTTRTNFLLPDFKIGAVFRPQKSIGQVATLTPERSRCSPQHVRCRRPEISTRDRSRGGVHVTLANVVFECVPWNGPPDGYLTVCRWLHSNELDGCNFT